MSTILIRDQYILKLTYVPMQVRIYALQRNALIHYIFCFANNLFTQWILKFALLSVANYGTYTAARASFLHSIGTIGRPIIRLKHKG